jgi:hypothetical protein
VRDHPNRRRMNILPYFHAFVELSFACLLFRVLATTPRKKLIAHAPPNPWCGLRAPSQQVRLPKVRSMPHGEEEGGGLLGHRPTSGRCGAEAKEPVMRRPCRISTATSARAKEPSAPSPGAMGTIRGGGPTAQTEREPSLAPALSASLARGDRGGGAPSDRSGSGRAPGRLRAAERSPARG